MWTFAIVLMAPVCQDAPYIIQRTEPVGWSRGIQVPSEQALDIDQYRDNRGA